MLRFFRQIRQRLLSENKFSKYLLYAIGEIVLVVAGILIALQINNWNEYRKSGQAELALLRELKADLEYNKGELEIIMLENQKFLKGYLLINTYIENNWPYAEELDAAFSNLDIWAQPYLANTTYETIKSRGIEIIRNDSLKKHINTVYSLNIKSLTEDVMPWEWSFSQNTTQRIMVSNVRRDLEEDLARPNDFERLKKDEEFRNFMSILIAIRYSNIDYSQDTLEAVEGLIAHIEEELKSRE